MPYVPTASAGTSPFAALVGGFLSARDAKMARDQASDALDLQQQQIDAQQKRQAALDQQNAAAATDRHTGFLREQDQAGYTEQATDGLSSSGRAAADARRTLGMDVGNALAPNGTPSGAGAQDVVAGAPATTWSKTKQSTAEIAQQSAYDRALDAADVRAAAQRDIQAERDRSAAVLAAERDQNRRDLLKLSIDAGRYDHSGRGGAGADPAAADLRAQKEQRLENSRRTTVVSGQLSETNRRLQNMSPRDPSYAATKQRADSLRGVLDQYAAAEQQGGPPRASAPALPVSPAGGVAPRPGAGAPGASSADADYAAAAAALQAAGGIGNPAAKARYDALLARIAAAHGGT